MSEPKKGNDLFKQGTKKGQSDSEVNFIKGELFDAELENRINSNIDIDENELDDLDFELELESNDDFDYDDNFELNDTLQPSKKKPSVEVLRRASLAKDEDRKREVALSRETSKLARDLIKEELPANQIRGILEVSLQDKELLMSNALSFGEKSKSIQEKRELIQKLDEITSTHDVNVANASFVLKWLKNRS